MADPYTDDQAPLVPQNVPHPQAAPQETTGLVDSWRSFIGDPHNRAAMIQFGLALSQPVAAGQNVGGHIGQAFGQAGEASDRVTAQQLKEEELGSKQDLRAAQAELAGARATNAGQRADYQLERLQLARELMELRRTQGDANARIRAQEAHRKLAQSANLTGDPPPPPFDEWYAGIVGGTSPTQGTSSPTARSAADQQALEWANANPRDPRAAAIKRRLGVP